VDLLGEINITRVYVLFTCTPEYVIVLCTLPLNKDEHTHKLSVNELSPSALTELNALTAAVSANDFTTAQKHHLELVKKDWASNSDWLLGLKSLLMLAKKHLGGS